MIPELYIPLWYDSNSATGHKLSYTDTFTFHSGTILIENLTASEIGNRYFTFHSGTILILSQKIPHGRAMFLYIPLWYDSNKQRYRRRTIQKNFTFHSGTILIVTADNMES